MITRRSAAFAQLAQRVEAECATRRVAVDGEVVDALLNRRIAVMAAAMGNTPRWILNYYLSEPTFGDPMAAAIADSIVTSTVAATASAVAKQVPAGLPAQRPSAEDHASPVAAASKRGSGARRPKHTDAADQAIVDVLALEIGDQIHSSASCAPETWRAAVRRIARRRGWHVYTWRAGDVAHAVRTDETPLILQRREVKVREALDNLPVPNLT